MAQIDHLMINRLLDVWVCESKHFAEGVAINEHGEFAAFYAGKPYGVPSPIEQNARHIAILHRFLASGAVKLPTRLGLTIKPSLKSLVLVSKGARISRPKDPKAKVSGLETVIKVDQLHQAIDKAVDDSNPLIIAKVVSEQTVQDLARQIASHHKPASFNWAAKFGLAGRVGTAAPASHQLQRPATAPTETRLAPTAAQLVQVTPQHLAPASLAATATAAPQGDGAKPGKEYRCHACAATVELKVARFCWFNKPKFGGNVYCMDCQKTVRA